MDVIVNHGVVAVQEQSQVGEARRVATRLGESLGFSENAVAEIAIVASELANNLIKHTPAGGKLVAQIGPYGALDLICVNKGNGTENHSIWMRDGYSTAGTLGTGLGAVSRLAQEFDLHSDSVHGTVVCARFIKDASAKSFDVGVINVPKEGEPVCGDSWSVVEEGEGLSILVADGLGHGLEAAEASREAINIFRAAPFLEPAELLQKMHAEMRKTRGAAVSIVQIDKRAGVARFSGLGNVSATLADLDTRRHFVPDNGTVGYEVRKIRTTELEWKPSSIVIMHSDGIASSWNLADYPMLIRHSASAIAGILYRDFGKRHDDITALVVKARH